MRIIDIGNPGKESNERSRTGPMIVPSRLVDLNPRRGFFIAVGNVGTDNEMRVGAATVLMHLHRDGGTRHDRGKVDPRYHARCESRGSTRLEPAPCELPS